MSVTLSAADLSRLHQLSAILLSPLNADSIDDWRRDACLALRQLVGGDMVYFLCDGLGDTDVLWCDGFPAPLAAAYRANFRTDEGTSRALRFGHTAFNQTSIIAGDWGGYNRDPMVNEMYRPSGVHDVIGLISHIESSGAMRGKGFRFQLGAGRGSYGTEMFGEKGLQLLNLLAPSFEAGISAVLATAAWRSALAESLDAIGTATWVFPVGGGAALHRNHAAARLLADDPEGAKIEETVTGMAANLASFARPAKSASAIETASDPSKTRVRTATAAYSVRGTFVGPSQLGAGSTILVVVGRVSSRPVAWFGLRRTYSLTAREAEVAKLIYDGVSTPEIARRLGISVHTARRHTEQLYAKLGVHSRGQAQLLIRET